MKTNEIKNGQTVWVQGHEFVASNVTISNEGNRKRLTFTGTCTANECNNSIRHTSYNGGTYGWFIA